MSLVQTPEPSGANNKLLQENQPPEPRPIIEDRTEEILAEGKRLLEELQRARATQNVQEQPPTPHFETADEYLDRLARERTATLAKSTGLGTDSITEKYQLEEQNAQTQKAIENASSEKDSNTRKTSANSRLKAINSLLRTAGLYLRGLDSPFTDFIDKITKRNIQHLLDNQETHPIATTSLLRIFGRFSQDQHHLKQVESLNLLQENMPTIIRVALKRT